MGSRLSKDRSDGAALIFVGDFTGHGLPASIGAITRQCNAFFLTPVDDLSMYNELAGADE